MKLTFENNNFVLREIGNTTVKLPRPALWLHNAADNSFRTNDISEAARFKSVSDESAQNLFRRLSLKALPFPVGGLRVPDSQTLLKFQRERGVPFILGQNKTYLAHQPGLGKTAQFVTAVNSKPGQTLVTMPSFLKATWAREITKWSWRDFPFIQVMPESERQFDIDWAGDYILCSHSMLQKDWVREGLLKRKIRHIGIDEAHGFKNHESNRSIALFGGQNENVSSPGLIYRSEHVVALSGTPMLNRPIELWSVLFAMAPEVIDYMSYYDFGFRYCGPWQDERGHWHFTGASHEQELHQRIQPFMQRIRKADVLEDLPPKVREVVLIETDDRAADVIELDQYLSKKINFDKEKIELGEYATLKHLTGLSKVKWVSNFVRATMLENIDEKIILFAYHRDVVQELKRNLAIFNPMVIQGGVGQAERTAIEDEFQTGHTRLIIGNINAMNLGLTLTAATRVLFAEYSEVPAQNEQAEDRAHRITQLDSVFVQYLVLQNSIDERRLESLLKKQITINKVIEGVTNEQGTIN